MSLPRFARAPGPPSVAARRLISTMAYELVPMAGVDRVIDDLAPAVPVTVSCSPVKGLAATQRLSEALVGRGHGVVPHLSARLVEDRAEVARLARWINDAGIQAVFVVAGDAPAPAGPYPDTLTLLGDLLAHDTRLERVGVTAYPDGHATIATDTLDAALLDKQELLAEARIDGWATTQMCFDTGRVMSWLALQRRRGVELPVHLGIPGVVDRSHLMKMGLRLGVGSSLRYLRKNRAVVGRLLTDRRFEPVRLVADVAAAGPELGVTGLHCFTFNRVAATRRWQESFTR